MIFCQMDVTARTTDPAAPAASAEFIVVRLAPGSLSARRTILYAGDPAGRKHLQQAGFAVEPYAAGALKADRVLVVSSAARPHWPRIRRPLPGGSKKTGPVGPGFELGGGDRFLPVKMETKSAEHIGAYFEPPSADFAAGRRRAGGRSNPRSAERPADHRRSLRSWATACSPCLGGPRGLLPDSALGIQCQAAEYQLTFRRTSCLVSRLLGNLGVQGRLRFSSCFASPVKLTDGQSPESPPADWVLTSTSPKNGTIPIGSLAGEGSCRRGHKRNAGPLRPCVGGTVTGRLRRETAGPSRFPRPPPGPQGRAADGENAKRV